MIPTAYKFIKQKQEKLEEAGASNVTIVERFPSGETAEKGDESFTGNEYPDGQYELRVNPENGSTPSVSVRNAIEEDKTALKMYNDGVIVQYKDLPER